VISAVVTLAVVWTRHEGELSVGLFKFISALESLLPKAASTESVPSQRQFGPVYAALAIQPLPPSIERQSKIQNRLDQLSREPCYTEAAVALGTALIEAGYPREAATSMQTFAGKCGKHENVLPVAYDALQKVGDSAGSLQVANRLVEAVPTSGTVRYWRAMAYEELGQFPNALSDYLSTIQLSGNPRYVSGDVFYRLSRVYAALGRPCDAIIPLETYASFDAVNRRTTQTASLIAEYAQAGNCAANFANGTARVAFTGGTPEVRTLSVNVIWCRRDVSVGYRGNICNHDNPVCRSRENYRGARKSDITTSSGKRRYGRCRPGQCCQRGECKSVECNGGNSQGHQ